MEKNAVLIEELRKPVKKDTGNASVQQHRLEDLSSKLQATERRALEAERAAQLAEHDARDKDKELNDTLSRIRLYQSVSLSLCTLSAVKCTPVTTSKLFTFWGCYINILGFRTMNDSILQWHLQLGKVTKHLHKIFFFKSEVAHDAFRNNSSLHYKLTWQKCDIIKKNILINVNK